MRFIRYTGDYPSFSTQSENFSGEKFAMVAFVALLGKARLPMTS